MWPVQDQNRHPGGVEGVVEKEKDQQQCKGHNEGQPAARSEQDGFYGAGPIAFVKVLEDWRAENALKGLERKDV